MPFEIPRGIWVPEIIWLAFYSPKSHGMSRENVKIEVILTGLLFIQTPSNMKGKCLILTNFQGGFGLESTNRDFEFGTKSPQFHGHAIGILPDLLPLQPLWYILLKGKFHLLDLFCILRFAPQKSYKKMFKHNLVINLSKCKTDAKCKTSANAKQI